MHLKPLVAVIIGLTVTSAASAANYRVENQVWGGYQIDGTINSLLFGSQPVNFNSNLADLHEWRNDGHTVSTRDSVKLKLR